MVVALKTIYRQQDVPSPEEFQKTYIKQFGPEPIDAIYHFSLEEDMMVTYFYNLITIFMHGDKSTIITGYCDSYNKYYSSCINDDDLKSIGVEMPFYRFSWILRIIFFRKLHFCFPFLCFDLVLMSTYLRGDIERSIIKTLPFILPEDRWG
ncbi:hypothetical protein SAMN05421779_103194 [Insolitispirillum peregrinum]|uniref:Uncharacterized protein n=2 Tax=Insolitispirillum peregrinum TaxID=80876 RepID=A0A1N7L9S8_9PROT|nr:hypothetical protein SAMN05421779_103194 [Insolitispirillum peregrinum]